MMKGAGWRAPAQVMGLVLVVVAIAMAGGGGAAPSPEYDRVIKAWFKGSSALEWGAGEFAKFEGRFPVSVQELCASAYMPGRCADLHIPPTNKDILSLKPEDSGYLGVVQDNSIAYLLDRHLAEVRKYRGDTLKAGPWDVRDTEVARNLLAKYPAPADFGPSMIVIRNDPFRNPRTDALRIASSFVVTLPGGFFEPYYRAIYDRLRAQLSNEEKATYSEAEWIHLTLSGYIEETGRLPQTWDEVVLARPDYPLQSFRNDFTGGYAEETSTPSPGDFRIITTIDTKDKVWLRHMAVIGYGANGRVVYPSIDAPLPTPESEIKIPPGQEVKDTAW